MKTFSDFLGATTSPETNALVKALAAAQKVFPTIATDTANSHLNSKYATYKGCCEALVGPLTANGFALPQFQPCYSTLADGTRAWILMGFLRHTSGEWICGSVPLIMHDQNRNVGGKQVTIPAGMQAFGSAITYGKRQLLLSLTGAWVGEVDNDGEVGDYAPAPQRHEEQVKSVAPDLVYLSNMLKKIAEAPDAEAAKKALAIVELRAREKAVSRSVYERCKEEFVTKWEEKQ
jgi:hypothetical protein